MKKDKAGKAIISYLPSKLKYVVTLTTIITVSSLITSNVLAVEYDANSESVFVSSLQDNLRLSIDLSARSVDFTRQNTNGYQYAIGFDIHKVFSSDTQDLGVLTAQVYFTQLNNHIAHPGFFQDKDDSEFVYRVFNFNYLGFSGDLPNIRIGHFEIPFGLEHTIPTNGTLRQYIHPRNLGIKADWGVSLNKQFTNYEYEVSYSTGGNQSLNSEDGSYVTAGRIGTLRDENTVVGLALYKSRLKGIERHRIGADFKYYWYRYGFFSEVSVGENEDAQVLNGLLEWNYRNRNESLLSYVQLGYFSQEINNDDERAVEGIIGVKYEPDNHWSLSSQLNRGLDTFSGKGSQTKFSLQVRYRF